MAHKSHHLTHTILNTDSLEIKELAIKAGVDVPFLRPTSLGEDDVPVKDLIKWTAQWWEKEKGVLPDIVVTLQPTSPFRCVDHIDTTIQMLRDNPEADSVISVSKSIHTPYKMHVLQSSGYLKPLFSEQNVVQRQDAPVTYYPNGIVFVTRGSTLVSANNLWGEKALPYVLPEDVALNIDTQLEFDIAEYLYIRSKEIRN